MCYAVSGSVHFQNYSVIPKLLYINFSTIAKKGRRAIFFFITVSMGNLALQCMAPPIAVGDLKAVLEHVRDLGHRKSFIFVISVQANSRLATSTKSLTALFNSYSKYTKKYT